MDLLTATGSSVATVPVVEVGAILGTGREAVILHKGERYRLRVTANDKLILTK
ncbi:hemin uptake protein HemP [Phreatobacter sp.]|uniref:hemin uptake protein HemP n=1 Tax=Phreatobacter sp. TaxID=1966341 RepID=UPI0025D936FE|nr:hemin uptake protein HemP [Phreatobacter sp.]